MTKKTFTPRKLTLVTILCISLLAITFIAFRLFKLHDTFILGSDAARDFLIVRDIYNNGTIKLTGPPSEYTWQGREFYFGPAPYYIILPALFFSHGDPFAASYYLILLNASVLVITVLILYRYLHERQTGYLLAFFCICTPAVIYYTRTYWNPYFTFPVAMLLLTLLVMKTYDKTNSTVLYASIGFLFGLGLQFHYGFIFAIFISLFWLLYTKKLHIHTLLVILEGGIVGFLPLIIYDLMKNLTNIQTLLSVLMHLPKGSTEFTFHSFYFISLLPFLFFFMAYTLAKFMKIHPRVTYCLLGIYAIASLIILNQTSPQTSQDVPYPLLQELTTTIASDDPKNFNIVDQLTTDNRAMALRYMLTTKGTEPRGVTEYAEAQTLYIYSHAPIQVLLIHPIWEISSFSQAKVTNIWKLHDGVRVYKLEKN